jgi:hypothetical protein
MNTAKHAPSPLGGHEKCAPTFLANALGYPVSSSDCSGCGNSTSGLRPPTINNKSVVGAQTDHLRKVNKNHRLAKQRLQQVELTWWNTHGGKFSLPDAMLPLSLHRNQMCPSGLALHHPAAKTLLQYAMKGCPTNTGNPWTIQQMQAAIDRGPHVSALVPEAVHQLDTRSPQSLWSRTSLARIVQYLICPSQSNLA